MIASATQTTVPFILPKFHLLAHESGLTSLARFNLDEPFHSDYLHDIASLQRFSHLIQRLARSLGLDIHMLAM